MARVSSKPGIPRFALTGPHPVVRLTARSARRRRRPVGERPDHGVDRERRQEAAGLVVHAALGVGHAVAGEGRVVVVPHPLVGVDVGVQRQADGVDRRRQRAVGLVLADPGVGAKRGGDREVAGELRQQARVQRPVVRQLVEPDPGVQDGRPHRGVRVPGVGPVDDAHVPARDAHVVGLALVGPGGGGWGDGVADDLGRRLVEQEEARCTAPVVLGHRDGQRGERPARAQLVQRKVSGRVASAARRKTIDADTARRPGACRSAATIAWPSIWLPSTTGRRSSARATLMNRPGPSGRTSRRSTRCAASPQVGPPAGSVTRTCAVGTTDPWCGGTHVRGGRALLGLRPRPRGP